MWVFLRGPPGIYELFLYIFWKNLCFLSSTAHSLGNQAFHTQPNHKRTQSLTRLQFSIHRWILRSLLQRRRNLYLYGTHGEDKVPCVIDCNCLLCTSLSENSEQLCMIWHLFVCCRKYVKSISRSLDGNWGINYLPVISPTSTWAQLQASLCSKLSKFAAISAVNLVLRILARQNVRAWSHQLGAVLILQRLFSSRDVFKRYTSNILREELDAVRVSLEFALDLCPFLVCKMLIWSVGLSPRSSFG